MDPITSAGLSGLNTGFERAADSSARVVEAFTPPASDDGSAALVELSMSAIQVRASATVVKTGQQLQQYILSVFA